MLKTGLKFAVAVSLIFGLLGCGDKERHNETYAISTDDVMTLYLGGDEEYIIEYGDKTYRTVPGEGLQETQ